MAIDLGTSSRFQRCSGRWWREVKGDSDGWRHWWPGVLGCLLFLIPNTAMWCCDVPMKPLQPRPLFLRPAHCLPCSSCGDPTDPQGLAKNTEAGKCTSFFFLFKILFSTCWAQLTYCFSSESFWDPPTHTCCDLFLLEARKPSAVEWFAGAPDLNTLSLIKPAYLGKLPSSDGRQRCLIWKRDFSLE